MINNLLGGQISCPVSLSQYKENKQERIQGLYAGDMLQHSLFARVHAVNVQAHEPIQLGIIFLYI